MTTKVCRTCGAEKPLDEFAVRDGKPGAHCRPCKREKDRVYRNRPEVRARRRSKSTEYMTRWRDKNPEANRAYLRAYRLRKNFGITVEEYEAMYRVQGGVCKICSNPETTLGNGGEVKQLAVDHCHRTGVNRGLLCQKCNMAIGLLDDSPEHLQGAIEYLSHAVTETDGTATDRGV